MSDLEAAFRMLGLLVSAILFIYWGFSNSGSEILLPCLAIGAISLLGVSNNSQ